MTAKQNSPETVLVTWTAPPAPPAAVEHLIQVTVANTTTTTAVAGTSHTISVSQFGVYSIRVMSLSHQHLPGESTPVNVTVRGRELDYAVPACVSNNRQNCHKN